MIESEKFETLRNFMLFKDIPNDDVMNMTRKVTLRKYHPDEVVVWQGNPSDAIYIIKAGIASVKLHVPGQEQDIKLAYLMPGNTFGEMGILGNAPRSANVLAVSDLECLVIQKEDFMDSLKTYSSVGINLSMLLTRKLLDQFHTLNLRDKKIRVILLFQAERGCGGTTLAHTIAACLKRTTGQDTVLTEYPHAYKLLKDCQINEPVSTYSHPAGYDLYIHENDPDLSNTSQASFLLDTLIANYTNIVIGLPDGPSDNLSALFEYANQIILLKPGGDESGETLNELSQYVKQHITPQKCTVIPIENCNIPQGEDTSSEARYDFTIPYLDLPDDFLQRAVEDPSSHEKLLSIVETLIDRLERTHQIKIFIPTTIDVDSLLDTSLYVDRTLQFLGDIFGGATSIKGTGVWKSDQVGLVDEAVHIVSSFATEDSLNVHLDDVIAYTQKIGEELKQEAMAIEVKNKLILL